jgi:hypothetical protein
VIDPIGGVGLSPTREPVRCSWVSELLGIMSSYFMPKYWWLRPLEFNLRSRSDYCTAIGSAPLGIRPKSKETRPVPFGPCDGTRDAGEAGIAAAIPE